MNSLILAATNSRASGYSGIILIILMIALMYFFMIRPQQKQRKQHQEMMNQLHRGDEVVTIGRLHGKVDSIDKQNQTVTLDCEGIYLTFDLVAIGRVAKRAVTAEEPQKENSAEDKGAADKSDSADKADKVDSKDDTDAVADKSAEDNATTEEDNQEK